MKIEVDKDFILEAHRAACDDWKKKIENQLPDLFRITVDKIKKLPEWKLYEDNGMGEVRATTEYVEIQLPVSNTEWTFAAWKLAEAVCKKFQYYPRHHSEYDCRWIHLVKES